MIDAIVTRTGTKAYDIVFKRLIIGEGNNMTYAGIRAVLDLVDYANTLQQENETLRKALQILKDDPK